MVFDPFPEGHSIKKYCHMLALELLCFDRRANCRNGYSILTQSGITVIEIDGRIEYLYGFLNRIQSYMKENREEAIIVQSILSFSAFMIILLELAMLSQLGFLGEYTLPVLVFVVLTSSTILFFRFCEFVNPHLSKGGFLSITNYFVAYFGFLIPALLVGGIVNNIVTAAPVYQSFIQTNEIAGNLLQGIVYTGSLYGVLVLQYNLSYKDDSTILLPYVHDQLAIV